MKINIAYLFVMLKFSSLMAQDIINPYIDYDGQLFSKLNDSYNTGFTYSDGGCGPYDGEYEIVLDLIGWGNTSKMLRHWNVQNMDWDEYYDLEKFYCTYSIELVSFPFSLDCAFPTSSNPYGDCGSLLNREFNVPSDNIYTSNNKWTYPSFGSAAVTYDLWRKLELTGFTRDQNHYTAISDESNSIISNLFTSNYGAGFYNRLLPHSVLKHVVNIHCGIDKFKPIIGSFEFYVDLTRGRYREYPFSDNTGNASPNVYDLVIRPVLVKPGVIYDALMTSNCNYRRQHGNGNCGAGEEGSTVNYFPFDPTVDDNCVEITYGNTAEYNEVFMDGSGMHNLPLADFTIIGSTSPRSFYGETLAGYTINGSNLSLMNTNTPFVHRYFIDKNIDLSIINNTKREIFNPSEVSITANDLHFPTNYTFKTIRGTYPFASDVVAANTAENGGPFTDPTNRDVPVETDLYKDFHITDPQYNAADHKLASLYHLESGSKLTIEPCVKIFDATFEINPGSEIVFEDWSTNQINVARYALIYNGGVVTKQDQIFLRQDRLETDKILNYRAVDYIHAGNSVDPGHTSGDYVVEPGADVRFTAGDHVSLEPGFEAAAGSSFTASIDNVITPPCGPLRIASKSNQNNGSISQNRSSIIYFTTTPNPASSDMTFMFDLAESGNATINVYNTMGKLISTIGDKSFLPKGKYTYSMSVVALSAGLYIAKLVTGVSEASLKFIKQ